MQHKKFQLLPQWKINVVLLYVPSIILNFSRRDYFLSNLESSWMFYFVILQTISNSSYIYKKKQRHCLSNKIKNTTILSLIISNTFFSIFFFIFSATTSFLLFIYSLRVYHLKNFNNERERYFKQIWNNKFSELQMNHILIQNQPIDLVPKSNRANPK